MVRLLSGDKNIAKKPNKQNTSRKGGVFVVVDIVERSVTTFFGVGVCFCNFRYLLQYASNA
jgi:hypothetical protein